VPETASQSIELTIVVSGQPERVHTNVHQKLAEVVREALNLSGNHGQPPSDWELRTADGVLLDQSLTVGAAALTSGMTLFLNPHAGAGGQR
jgi:Protein of Unknown function (DUF2604)